MIQTIFINNSSNGRLNPLFNPVQMDKKEQQLLLEMSHLPALTHKIQLSNSSSFRHLVQQQPQELPPHNLCSTSKELNRLAVEVKRD